MSTKADVKHHDTLAGEAHDREQAPSAMRQDQPQVGRWIGTIGLALALIGFDWVCWLFFDISLSRLVVSWITHQTTISFLPTLLGTPFFVIGLGMMLFHAAWEKDLQLRRSYGLFGAAWLLAGVVLTVFGSISLAAPVAFAFASAWFLPGVGCLGAGLLFLLAFLRNEEEVDWRQITVYVVGGLGAAAAVFGFLLSLVSQAFVAPHGVLLVLFGLGALWAFIYLRGEGEPLGDYAALGTVALGLIVFAISLVRSYVWPLFFSPPNWSYAVPTGVVLMGLGLLYPGLYVLLRLDYQVLALTRRELGSFFCSPIAYAALLASAVIAWVSFLWFMWPLGFGRDPSLPEPIIGRFLFGLFPVLTVIGLVPVITMNTFSDERRTGTLEMTLTAPVEEFTVVLGKFLATLIFFLIAWAPWVLFLAALYVLGGAPFDFKPLLSFLIALACMGAGFIALGNFFSSLTRHWYVSALLTSGAMFVYLGMYLGVLALENIPLPWPALTSLGPVLKHMSFVHLWEASTDGRLQPSYLLFHLSAAVFFVFLTVKVLESRKWA